MFLHCFFTGCPSWDWSYCHPGTPPRCFSMTINRDWISYNSSSRFNTSSLHPVPTIDYQQLHTVEITKLTEGRCFLLDCGLGFSKIWAYSEFCASKPWNLGGSC